MQRAPAIRPAAELQRSALQVLESAPTQPAYRVAICASSHMRIDTCKVTGRRTLNFNTLDEILYDVDYRCQGNVRSLGNWSPGQNLDHLTIFKDDCVRRVIGHILDDALR